jgi:hypothetical protein
MQKDRDKPQQQREHPAEWEHDLNPDRMAGQNIRQKEQLRTAAEIKDLTRRLRDFTDDELRQIPILAPGQRLQQGAVYLDLRRDSASQPITATGAMSAGDDHLYAAKAETPYELWNRLVAALGSADATEKSDLPEETVDETIAESFPTSDPPAWTTGREPTDPNAPEAPREKRREPQDPE